MIRPRRRRNRSLVIGLYLNASLLLAILAALLARGGGGGSLALAAPQTPPIAGGGGFFLMPAQFSVNSWGCYIMDIDAQTLCAYQYFPNQNQLRLTAARHFRYDRLLKAYNTWPLPPEVQHLKELEDAATRGKNTNPNDGSGDPVPTHAPPAPDQGVPSGGAAAPAGPATSADVSGTAGEAQPPRVPPQP